MRPLLALGAALLLAAASPVEPVTGQWLTQNRDGVINIRECEHGLCGTVMGVTAFKPDGSPPVDIEGHTQCNLPLITDGMRSGDGKWFGHIRNPEDGHVHEIELSVDPQGRLHLRGYVLVPLFGKTVVWTRFHGHLTPDCHMT